MRVRRTVRIMGQRVISDVARAPDTLVGSSSDSGPHQQRQIQERAQRRSQGGSNRDAERRIHLFGCTFARAHRQIEGFAKSEEIRQRP